MPVICYPTSSVPYLLACVHFPYSAPSCCACARAKIDRQADLTLESSDEALWKNESGLATVVAADVAILQLCVLAHEKALKKERWSSDLHVVAADAIACGPCTRLALALRANTWLKSQWAEVTRQAGNVGDKACCNMNHGHQTMYTRSVAQLNASTAKLAS